MISYDRSSSKSLLVWGLAISAGLAVALAWWFHGRNEVPEVAQAASSAALAPHAGRPMLGSASAAMATLTDAQAVLPDGRPADLSQDEWKALQDTVGKGPNAASEMKRVTAYLRFQRSFTRWQSDQDSNRDVQGRKQLAEQLLASVPERLKQSEVTVGEALMIGTALLGDLEPDDAARSVKLDQLRIKLEAMAPRTDNAAEMREANCLAEYKRRETIIQQEFMSKPEAQRDRKKFETEIDAARRAVYDGADCGH